MRRDHFKKGKEYLFLGQADAALTHLDASVKADPEHSLALSYRSLSRRLAGRLQEAMEDADAVVAISPDLAEGYLSRALVYLTQDNLEQAILDYYLATDCSTVDIDGDILLLNVFLILAETIAGGEENDEGLIFKLRHTPIAKAGMALVDGNPLLALEFLNEAPDSTPQALFALAMGLVSYRLGEKETDSAVAYVLVEWDEQNGVGVPLQSLRNLYDHVTNSL